LTWVKDAARQGVHGRREWTQGKRMDPAELSNSCEIFLRSTFGVEPGSREGRELARLARVVDLGTGERAPTDRNQTNLVYLARGATKLCAHASQDRCQIIAFHFGGDIFTIPPDRRHRHHLVALRDSRAILFPARQFYDCAAQRPPVLRALLERSQIALHRAREKAVALGQKSARERVAGFLLTMAERLDPVDENARIFDLPMSRREIGESLGLTIETVSRQFSELKDAGVIATSGRSLVELRDLEALERLAGHYENAVADPFEAAN